MKPATRALVVVKQQCLVAWKIFGNKMTLSLRHHPREADLPKVIEPAHRTRLPFNQPFSRRQLQLVVTFSHSEGDINVQVINGLS